MPNIIDIMDRSTLEALKDQLANSSSKEEVLRNFLNQYKNTDAPIIEESETITANVNFGLNRTQTDFNKDIDNMSPYSKVQNFDGIREAQGEWKPIYGIAYPTGDTTTINVEIATPSHQKIYDKAA